jgi:proline dehydrogenase
MLEQLPRALFSVLGSSAWLGRLASSHGLRNHDSFARRFIAGETIAEAINAARILEASGLAVTFDLLGEQVTSTPAAAAATRAYLDIIDTLGPTGASHQLSVKLTQLGIDVDRATSIDNLRRILDAAGSAGFFVRVDMERSTYTAQTFDAFETVWNIGYRNSGIAIQAYLRRSTADVARMNALGASVRLVKGAYHESRDVAFNNKADVDASFKQLTHLLLEHGTNPAIATHDPEMIAETIRFAERRGIPKSKYEFEMLFGVRRDLQTSLAAQGHRVRVYLPFGTQWFPYFMRRLGERPANVGFVLRSILRERRAPTA